MSTKEKQQESNIFIDGDFNNRPFGTSNITGAEAKANQKRLAEVGFDQYIKELNNKRYGTTAGK